MNELPARRFVHGRLDYKLGTDLLGWVPYVRQLRLQAVPFVDVGAALETQDRDGTVRTLDDPDVRAAAGVGLQRNLLGVPGGAGQLRVDVTRRLDRGEDDWTSRLMITMSR